MTARQCLSCGLITGLTMAETMSSAPGLVFDLFFAKRKYDDVLHGIRRQSDGDWGED